MSAGRERTLIDELLEDQRELTAAEKFSRAHDRKAPPAHEKYYRDLIPLSLPKAGEQYAFEVDLDKCSGCKACVTACHNLNGLAEDETWRAVGSLHGGTSTESFQVTVTTACHHCVDPACANGCPTLAYEKDSITGIVRHLDDQCIGCQYCALMCPYEVPRYNLAKGIVRKCDMCSSRLAESEAPACVQACPNEAIRITIVDKAVVTASTITGDQLTPDAPDSAITIPTTRYRTEREFPKNTRAADSFQFKPAKAHPPLVAMLIFTQLSVGMFGFALVYPSFLVNGGQPFAKVFYSVAFVAGLGGILASVLHLGRPMEGWRAVLGWRESWLSREVLLFGLFITVAGIQAIGLKGPWILPLTVITGLAAIFSSVMVYAKTQRAFWSLPQTSLRFFGSAVLLGLAASITLCVTLTGKVLVVPILALMFFTLLKIGWEAISLLRPASDPALERSAQLQAGPLRHWMRARFVCGVMGGFVLPSAILLGGPLAPALALAAFCFRMSGEVLERHLFFVAVSPAKMPGGIAS